MGKGGVWRACGMALLALAGQAFAATPLDNGGWTLVAHMKGSGGMFAGNGNLAPDYEWGTFVEAPTADTKDFARPFTDLLTPDSRILFITGDLAVWGMTSYQELRAQIVAQDGNVGSNIVFETHLGGTKANVLSRADYLGAEDPWISIVNGDHFEGIAAGLIVWGENGYDGPHTALKNSHGGLNVYIEAVPEPGSYALMVAGLAGLALLRRRGAAGCRR